MPWQELNRFQAITDAAQEGPAAAGSRATMGLIEQSIPIIKLPIALAVTHTQFPSGRPLLREREPRRLTGGVLKALGVRALVRTGEDGRTYEVMDEHYTYALETALPHLAVAAKLFDDPKHDPVLEDQRRLRFAREASGVSLLPANPDEAVGMRAGQLTREIQPYTRGRSP